MSALYTFTRTPLYEGTAKSSDLLPGQGVEYGFHTYAECVDFVNSPAMLESLAARITGDDLDRMLAPYAPSGRRTQALLLKVLAANRRAWSGSLRGPLFATYRHPDPEIAARIPNMIFDELFGYASRRRIDQTIGRADRTLQKQQLLARKVEDLTKRLESLSGMARSSSAAPGTSSADSRSGENHVVLQTELETAKQALAEADREIKTFNMLGEWELSSVRRVDNAKPPSEPVYPSHRLHLGLGVLSGLVFAGLIAGILSRPRKPERGASS